MIKATINRIPLLQGWHEHDPQGTRMGVGFPLFEAMGTQRSSVVYFELEPGQRLDTHTDSAEEILLVLQGIVDATVGDETGQAGAGDMVLIPAMAPHGVRNVGSGRVRCLGFFAAPKVVSTFRHEILPVRQKVGGTPPFPLQEPPLTWEQVFEAMVAAMNSGGGQE